MEQLCENPPISGNNAIPDSILSKIFSEYLNDSIRDIFACAQTCQTWKDAAYQQHIWKSIAYKKYGENVARFTINIYKNNWVKMLRDDNKKGAFPSIEFGDKPLQCFYKHNTRNYFDCCLIVSVKWHRPLREVRVYIDARGQQDLRHPSTSSFCSPTRIFYTKGVWKPDSNCMDRRGHYKGHLSFRQDIFQECGTYKFCYANSSIGHHDYPDVPLIHRLPGGDLINAFDRGERKNRKYATDKSPFFYDSDRVDRLRWDPILFGRFNINSSYSSGLDVRV